MSPDALRQWMRKHRVPLPRFRFAHPTCRTCVYPSKYAVCVPVTPDRRRVERRAT